MLRFIALAAPALTAVWLLVSAGPTFGQSPNGTVTASVTVNVGPCISLSATSFTYAPAEFSTSQTTRTTLPNSARPVVTNCSNQSERILARGSTASGANNASWDILTSFNCANIETNKYKHELKLADGVSYLALTATDQAWESGVAANDTRTVDGRLTMPCNGSSGAGQTMTMPIFLTAAIP